MKGYICRVSIVFGLSGIIGLSGMFLTSVWAQKESMADKIEKANTEEMGRVNRPMMAHGVFKRRCNRYPGDLVGTNVKNLCSEIYKRMDNKNGSIENYVAIYGIEKESNPKNAVIFHGEKIGDSYKFHKLEVINEDGVVLDDIPSSLYNKTLYGQKYDPFRLDGDFDPDRKLEPGHSKIKENKEEGYIQFCFDDNPSIADTEFKCYNTVAIIKENVK